MSTAPRIIDVYAELGCPFTHLGLLRFVERRNAESREEVRLHVRAWPLEVVNGQPLDPGFIAEEIDEICAQLETTAFVGFEAARFPTTSMPGMALESLAYEHDAVVGERVSLELRDLLFCQGVDVSEPGVVADLAQRHGVPLTPGALDDHRRVLADHARGVALGVVGSPYFVTPAGGFFCPALEVGRDDTGHLRVHADPEGFDRFVDACLS